jgi:MFS family permease
VDGYLLAYVSVIPVSGWVSERFGSRNAWMFAVAAFLAGSVLCGLSWSLPVLIAFRVLQGIGGGMVLPITITILTPAVIALAYGISQAAGANGFAAVSAWLPLGIGVLLLIAFTCYSLAAKGSTLIDVRVFARRSFGLSSVITFVGGFSLYALMFLLPIFYQQIRGESVLDTGLLLIPQGLGTMLFLVLSKRIAARIDGRYIVAGGVLLLMIGVLPFAFAGAHGGEPLLLAAQFIQGVGFGAVSIPVMTLAFASLSSAEAPRGSAAFSVVQRVGAPFGIAVIAVILQGYLSHASTSAAALGAFTSTFWWIFGLTTVPLFLAFFIPRKKNGSAAPGQGARAHSAPAPLISGH